MKPRFCLCSSSAAKTVKREALQAYRGVDVSVAAATPSVAWLPYRFALVVRPDEMIEAMRAGAIPIYCGTSDVDSHLNPRSFVDARGQTDAADRAQSARNRH